MPTRRRVSPEAYRRITAAALAALSLIVVTGAAVRLTGSGLGCTDWPNCEEGQFVPSLEYHALIEFVNRVFTGVVSVSVVLAVLGSLRRTPFRRDLVRWSWGLVAGVIGQIILGAVVVRMELVPGTVIGHFLLSMVLVWNAVVLHHKAGTPERAASTPAAAARGGLRSIDTRIAALWFALSMVVIVTGTIVTGSGPHGGDENAERLPFHFGDVARVHGITVVIFFTVTLLLAARLRRGGVALPVQRSVHAVLGVLVVQATIGYVQYFTEVPALLVGFHIAGATLLWISVVRAVLVLRDAPAAAPAVAAVAPVPA
jgi:cytochrome c oxidase assembly protein subunit 15